MAKRGPLSLDDKKVILEALKTGEELDVKALMKELDRTENSIKVYMSELEFLGMMPQENDVEEETVDTEKSEVDKLKSEHIKTIMPSENGVTMMTPAGSQYGDEVAKKRNPKQKYGKYAKNVIKINPER